MLVPLGGLKEWGGDGGDPGCWKKMRETQPQTSVCDTQELSHQSHPASHPILWVSCPPEQGSWVLQRGIWLSFSPWCTGSNWEPLQIQQGEARRA